MIRGRFYYWYFFNLEDDQRNIRKDADGIKHFSGLSNHIFDIPVAEDGKNQRNANRSPDVNHKSMPRKGESKFRK